MMAKKKDSGEDVILSLRVSDYQREEFRKLQKKFGKTQKDLLASMMLAVQVSRPDRYKSHMDTLEKMFGSIAAEITAIIKEADADVAISQNKYIKMHDNRNALLDENEKLQKKYKELESSVDRLKRDYEEKLAQKQKELERLQFALDAIQEKIK